MSSRLAHLQSRFAEVLEGSQGVTQGALEAGEGRIAGGADPVLLDLRMANLARVLADGDLVGRWELGAAVGRMLTERQPELRGH